MDDDSTLLYNVTMENDELIKFLALVSFYDLENELGIFLQRGSWQRKFNLDFTKMMTQFGFCLSWNVIEPDELLNLELLVYIVHTSFR